MGGVAVGLSSLPSKETMKEHSRENEKMQAASTLIEQRDLAHLVGQIGNTTLKRFRNLETKAGVEIYAKLEWENLSGSIKARAAFEIIKDAYLRDLLNKGRRLLDASSGNTGIAYAEIAQILNIPLTLCIPENASRERIEKLRELNAELILTSRFDSTDGAQRKALQLKEDNPDLYYYADQYKNENNWKAHYNGTAEEIWQQSNHRITHFVNAIGTSGTFVGTGRKLKELKQNIQLIALQPDSALHGMEGWKHLDTAIVPEIYDANVADEVREVSTESAYEFIKKIKQEEGLLISPSAAANLSAASKLSSEIEQGVIVTTLADNADKYGEVINFLFS